MISIFDTLSIVMSSPFGFVSGTAETVPFTARYTYPSQATKALQTIIKLPPKNGGVFGSPPVAANVIRFEFPASGYLNVQRTVLEFDFYFDANSGGGTAATAAWIQNNIKSIFRRARILYGAQPLEDIQNYNGVVRALTESAVPGTYSNSSQVSFVGATPGAADCALFNLGGSTGGVLEGIGSTLLRQQITNLGLSSAVASGIGTSSTSFTSPQRYCVQLDLGVLQQGKLIPLKWMSSQLAIELEIAPAAEFAILLPNNATQGSRTAAGYLINVNMIATLMEFDNSYDAAFFKGMMAGGIPIKFSSWHNTKYALATTTAYCQIQERARSVKQAFACFRAQTAALSLDTHAMYSSNLLQYQWRLGGVFFPAQPVLTNPGSFGITSPNSGSEALVELMKAIGSLGEYHSGSNIDWLTYAGPFSASDPYSQAASRVCTRALTSGHAPDTVTITQSYDQVPRFLIGCQFETSAGFEISGVNAEEQSDLQLQLTFSGNTTPSNYSLGSNNMPPLQAEVYVHYDALLIIRPNNEIDLIQ